MKPAEIIDRDAEWRTLETMWRKDRPQLVFVLGRRRVGKSFVLARFARAVGGLYYQATRRTEPEQLAHLSRIVGDRFDDGVLKQGVPFPSWEALLGYLTERARSEPLLVVLDELPYLVGATPALPSILQSAWDHDWAGSRLKVVLSGSFVSAMRALEGADQPLYGRRTARLALGPFAFQEATGFMPSYAPLDQLTAYGLFGNLPGHLALIDPALSVAENASAALLDPSGPLVDDAQHMLDAFVGDGRVHYSILEAIATGDRTWSGIARRVGQSGGSLQRPLRWLEEMGLVQRVAPITDKDPRRSKRALHRITDPYITLWHGRIAPLLHAGSIGLVEPRRLWDESVSVRLSEHLGPVFEEACREFVRRGEGLPIWPLRVGEWWDSDSRDQVDVVAVDGDGRVLVAECKWGEVTHHDLRSLRSRAARVAAELDGRGEPILALFSARDEADSAVREAVSAGDVLYFVARDLATQHELRAVP
ncbi:MAG: ATPase AAA [Myxococcales bacterium]